MSREEILLQGDLPTREGHGFPFHVLAEDTVIVRSFGARSRGPGSASSYGAVRALVRLSDSTFASASMNSYEIEVWTTSGRLVKVVSRRPSWYTPWLDWSGDLRSDAPPPRLMALAVDSVGRLWTLLSVADEGWRRSSARGESRVPSVRDMVSAFDAIIEVLDIERGALVASLRVPHFAVDLPRAGLLIDLVELPSGEVAVRRTDLSLRP